MHSGRWVSAMPTLGALLMAAGLPYDSDAGRAYAGAVTALMTGRAYHQSALVARDCGGPFSGFAENRESMLRVMGKHRAAVDEINETLIPGKLCWTPPGPPGTTRFWKVNYVGLS